ncbi:hypothetical protein GA0061098_102134 [Bradyrhizobium shewense]|uniref:Uncharacterized protein n=1 Tax=Bradyrhizobium shewense TaxID=1761772 RepID=A0A1C3XNL1_9BRAD|nr:hypothetical protein [Bradyrhizobium shewense]SCB53827.1 hypothetical protein GA0061098_102134 [Bradyrhizobium shewense]
MTEAYISETALAPVASTGEEITQSRTKGSNDDRSSYLIHGSSSHNDPVNDPIWYVNRFRKHREQSVREVVKSTIAVCEGLDAIGEDQTEFRRFVKALADAKVMSQAEAAKKKRADMSTLSKIQKIYEHRDVILHQSVADKLCTGYSVLYELGLLIDQLMPEGDITEEVKGQVSKLLGLHLETLDGDLTRRWIKGVRESVGPIATRERKVKSGEPPDDNESAKAPDLYDEEDHHDRDYGDDTVDNGDADNEDDDSFPETLDNAEGGSTLDRSTRNFPSKHLEAKAADIVVSEASKPITAAMVTVHPLDEEMVVRASQTSEWQRLADQMDEDSVLIVFSPLQILLNIGQVIETFDGFRCSNAYLLAEPHKSELTSCNVLAIYERGEGVSIDGVPNWKVNETPVLIMEQFLQGVSGRSVFFFGDAPPVGWEILTIDEE